MFGLTVVFAWASFVPGCALPDDSSGAEVARTMYPALQSFLSARGGEFDQISVPRQERLREFAREITRQLTSGEPGRLNFICTHNSRRSHMAQLWATVAAAHFHVARIHTYSGGTEATAFNPRAVAALQRAGFQVVRTTEDANPIYHVRFAEEIPPLTCFSKVFDQAPNPRENYIAVLVCSEADASCPAVAGASTRIALPYDDPKIADDTPAEAARYDERCAQIAREMLFVFAEIHAARQ